jgi:hypothetical protein
MKSNMHTVTFNSMRLDMLTAAQLTKEFHADMLTCSQCMKLGPILQSSLSYTISTLTVSSSDISVRVRNGSVSDKYVIYISFSNAW